MTRTVAPIGTAYEVMDVQAPALGSSLSAVLAMPTVASTNLVSALMPFVGVVRVPDAFPVRMLGTVAERQTA
jgi:hypothetical protein